MAKSDKKVRVSKECGCIALVNKALAPKNSRLVTGLSVDFKTGKSESRLCIATEKIDKAKRGGVGTLVPTYCPFCGKKSNVK